MLYRYEELLTEFNGPFVRDGILVPILRSKRKRRMKRVAALILLVVVSGWLIPAMAQSGAENTQQSQKAALKEQKALANYEKFQQKAQLKAQQKADKKQQKANEKYAKEQEKAQRKLLKDAERSAKHTS